MVGTLYMTQAQILLIDLALEPMNELTSRLKEAGFSLDELEGDTELMDKLSSCQPDLVLLNSSNGETQTCIQTCQTIKKSPNWENLPIVFVESQAPSKNTMKVDAYKHGASDFLEHDIDIDEATARIEALLKMKKALHQSQNLANQLTELNTELYERNMAIEKELHTARQLQQSLLPPIIKDKKKEGEAEQPQSEGFAQFSKVHHHDDNVRVTGVYLPCDALGGDLYDVVQFSDGNIGVSVSDVSGHGVPAGFITAIYKASFYRTNLSYDHPNDILFHLNNELYNIIKTGEYVTSVYCRIKDDGKKMEYSGAGHPYPILYRAKTGEVETLEANGSPLVWFPNMDYPLGEVGLEPGDRVLMYTDGITELRNTKEEMFGEEALEKLFKEIIENHPDRILDQLVQDLSDFTQGEPLGDDMSIVLVSVL